MSGKRGFFNDKLGMAIEAVGWWILAIAALIIILTIIFFLFGKGESAISDIKNWIRFGR